MGVGFSIILVDDWQSVPSARIGHFNFIKCQALHMEEHAQIGHLNLAMGYVKILLEKNSYIGNFNSFHAKKHKSKCYSLPYLRLHQSAKIMGHHYLDLIQSIDIGERSILAGAFSQCWTHIWKRKACKIGRHDKHRQQLLYRCLVHPAPWHLYRRQHHIGSWHHLFQIGYRTGRICFIQVAIYPL